MGQPILTIQRFGKCFFLKIAPSQFTVNYQLTDWVAAPLFLSQFDIWEPPPLTRSPGTEAQFRRSFYPSDLLASQSDALIVAPHRDPNPSIHPSTYSSEACLPIYIRKSFKNSYNAMEQELSFQKNLQKKTKTKTKTKTETKTKINTKTKTKNEKDPIYAIFLKSRGCKDIK